MGRVSNKDREIVRDELASVAEYLHVKRGKSIREVKRLIREVALTDY